MGLSKHLSQSMLEHKEKIKGPHFLFSAENPRFKQQTSLTHEQTLHHLKGAGFDAHEVSGHYGSPERSIAVYGVSPIQSEGLHDLASRLGQDSSIYSTGKHHEMRFHHGENKGKSNYGEGTKWHLQKPSDFFTSLPGGHHHFTHNFDFEKLHPSGKLHRVNEIVKNNNSNEESSLSNTIDNNLKKNENEKINLVHYSSQENLKHIDPKFKQTGVDARTKGRDTEHPHSFYYVEGTEPESLVVGASSHKYKTSINPSEKPIYDLGKDPHGFVSSSMKENQGALNMDMVHNKIKSNGYHGFRNTKHPQLNNVVAMYHPLPVEHHEKIR